MLVKPLLSFFSSVSLIIVSPLEGEKQWRNTHPSYYGPRRAPGYRETRTPKVPLGNFKDLQKLTRFFKVLSYY